MDIWPENVPLRAKAKGMGRASARTTIKGYPKGQGKADGKTKGYNKGKSGGKGYMGTCWTCGKLGHKSNECNNMLVDAVDGRQAVEDTVEVGGVWMIGNVESDVDPQTSKLLFDGRQTDDEETLIGAVDAGEKMTRESGMVFNVAKVGKPLASAVKVCEGWQQDYHGPLRAREELHREHQDGRSHEAADG